MVEPRGLALDRQSMVLDYLGSNVCYKREYLRAASRRYHPVDGSVTRTMAGVILQTAGISIRR